MSEVVWSEAQTAHRARFKQAVAYARSALAEPGLRDRYEKRPRRQHKRAWDVAMPDYFAGKDLLAKYRGSSVTR